MSQKAITRTSKFLSFVLRHKPDAIGQAVDDGRVLDGELIRVVVETNEKTPIRLE